MFLQNFSLPLDYLLAGGRWEKFTHFFRPQNSPHNFDPGPGSNSNFDIQLCGNFLHTLGPRSPVYAGRSSNSKWPYGARIWGGTCAPPHHCLEVPHGHVTRVILATPRAATAIPPPATAHPPRLHLLILHEGQNNHRLQRHSPRAREDRANPFTTASLWVQLVGSGFSL